MVHWLTPAPKAASTIESLVRKEPTCHIIRPKRSCLETWQKLDRPLVRCSTNTRAPSSLKPGGLRRALTSCLAKFTAWKEPEEATPYVQETCKKPQAQEDQVSCGYMVSHGLWGLTWTTNVVSLNLCPLCWQMRRQQAQHLVSDQQWTHRGHSSPNVGTCPTQPAGYRTCTLRAES